MKRKNLIRIVAGTALILLVPLVAMQFTSEVRWGVADFAIMGILLLGAGVTFELVASRVSPKYRAVIAAAVAVAVVLVWAELAVGLFGTPFAGS